MSLNKRYEAERTIYDSACCVASIHVMQWWSKKGCWIACHPFNATHIKTYIVIDCIKNNINEI